MGRWLWWHRAVAASLTAAAIATAGLAAVPAASATTSPVCRSSSNATLAAKMSSAILAAMKGRASQVGLHVDDPSLGLICSYHSYYHFYSASTVKATILAALLRKANQQGRSLTSTEKSEAWLMITQSDNNAATYLWNDTGRTALQHFLNLAGMSKTVLGPGGYWGLTEETAYDESLLLQLLVNPNSVLTTSDRNYELYLMSHVISSQRWGTPYGVPSGYTVHVKNGWLPVSGYGWIINSLGAFTKTGHDYTMDVLTDDNSSMAYGITTIEKIAYAVNHNVNGSSTAAPPTAATAARFATGIPDETIPPSMTPAR